ncbi:hypothetical protein C0033_04785 [Clostridium sp. chh4-2]|uniref:DUF4194 domain-containing protein n=1 Tax=Clostridium sp. chh4-2 TaxID=2067550 RepID=UPI000CCDF686|nr:DUF4194 domain-containing protein [Clostridium sp. chh4-2]PNV63394.1 hypothetical protein C0033_04785 [Clostridium sp. chh4-2]
MIEYYETLSQEEQQQLTETIQLLLRQTFILERKFDRKSSRFQNNREFRICNKHLEFIREYFSISGIYLHENSQMGVIYIQGENLLGDKLPKLATLYILILKIIYEEQMASVSTSVNVYTTLGEINERLGSYRLLKNKPSVTEIRKAITILKRYQIIDPLDVLEELDGKTRMIIYPCINVVLLGDDVRALVESFAENVEETEGEEEDDESEI